MVNLLSCCFWAEKLEADSAGSLTLSPRLTPVPAVQDILSNFAHSALSLLVPVFWLEWITPSSCPCAVSSFLKWENASLESAHLPTASPISVPVAVKCSSCCHYTGPSISLFHFLTKDSSQTFSPVTPILHGRESSFKFAFKSCKF